MAQLALDSAPERFSVAGHSMGGRVALEVFRMAPDQSGAAGASRYRVCTARRVK